jgi:SAM-dependent methyltransferase
MLVATTPKDALDWENGSKNDPVRNDLIIPRLADFIEKERPSQILDLGAGTGYISRNISSKLSYRPIWNLVDTNSDRLSFGRQLAGDIYHLEITHGDFMSEEVCLGPADLALLIFTLLEVSFDQEAAKRIGSLVSENGHLAVVLPDVLQDLIAIEDSHDALNRYILGATELDKVDPFTGQSYPFRATRTELIIEAMNNVGFLLQQLSLLQNDLDRIYLMIFKKRRL